MWKVALRNIFRHKARSIVSLSTIAVGCVALMFIGGFFDNNLHQMREAYINFNIGHLQIYRKGFEKYGAITPYKYLIKDPDRIAGKISAMFPQVRGIGYRLQFAGLISTGQTSAPCWVQGVDPLFDKTFRMSDYKDIRDLINHPEVGGLAEVVEGEGLKPQESPYMALLGLGLAQSLDVMPGTYVTVLNTTVQGGNNATILTVNGKIRTSSKDFDDVFVRLPLSIAQKMLNTKMVQNIVVKLNNTDDTDQVKQRLEKMFADDHEDLEMKTWYDISDFYTKTAKLFDMFHLIMRVVITIAVVLGVYNTMNMAVLERYSEIGTIMAMGVKPKGVIMLFLYEGLLLGLIGGVLGLTVGSVFVAVIGHYGIMMPPPPGTTIEWLSQPSFVGSVAVFTFFLSIFIGALSSLAPAIKASRLPVTEALKYR